MFMGFVLTIIIQGTTCKKRVDSILKVKFSIEQKILWHNNTHSMVRQKAAKREVSANWPQMKWSSWKLATSHGRELEEIPPLSREEADDLPRCFYLFWSMAQDSQLAFLSLLREKGEEGGGRGRGRWRERAHTHTHTLVKCPCIELGVLGRPHWKASWLTGFLLCGDGMSVHPMGT